MNTSCDASPDTPPELTRRRFLAAGGAAAALALAPSRLLAAIESHTPPKPDLSSWSNVRAQFDLDKGLLHFSSFFLASHPKPVRDAIESYRRALDANPYLVVDHGMFTDESSNLQRKVCVEIAPYLGARPDEIALTPNTTTGLALVYHGLPLKPGDDVLTTTHDHYSHHESIRFATERAGATSRRIALYDRPEDADADEIVHRVVSALKPETRAVGVTWVHSSTGVRLPIRAIAEGLRSAQASRDEATRARLIVDGVHGLGAVDAVLADLGADFVCAGTHKWMFAPRGTGIAWARAENWARLRPVVPTFSSQSAYGAWLEDRTPSGPPTAADLAPGGFLAYEHQWAMGAAFKFHDQIGRRRIGDRIRALNDQCKDGLARLSRVRLHTPRNAELSAGLVAFEVDGHAPADVVERLLAKKIVASTSPYRVTYARLAPSLVNTPEDVETALAAVRAIAGA